MNDLHQPVIVCRNLSKVFVQGSRVLHVLKSVDLTVHRGDVVSIVGASGTLPPNAAPMKGLTNHSASARMGASATHRAQRTVSF